MVLTYSILEKERRDITVWCKVEYFVDGNVFILDVPSFNPITDQEVYDNIYNAGVAYQLKLIDEQRIDDTILPNLEA
jgi:hypothetical protein